MLPHRYAARVLDALLIPKYFLSIFNVFQMAEPAYLEIRHRIPTGPSHAQDGYPQAPPASSDHMYDAILPPGAHLGTVQRYSRALHPRPSRVMERRAPAIQLSARRPPPRNLLAELPRTGVFNLQSATVETLTARAAPPKPPRAPRGE